MTKNATPRRNAKARPAAVSSRKKAKSSSPAVSKTDRILTLLRRAEGASLEEMMKATGWQQHSLRGFMSGTLAKRKGLTIASDKIDGQRHYRILDAGIAS